MAAAGFVFQRQVAINRGDLHDEIHMTQPRGFELVAHKWSDVSLFVRKTKDSITFMLVYVDDIVITCSSSNTISSIIQQLNKTFVLKDMGSLHYFLGIGVTKTCDGGMVLSQTKYIKDILLKASMQDYKAVPTPMTSNLTLTSTDGEVFNNLSLYRSVVGSL
ncbi:uncharacterized protein LOC107640515 [Arachis ipaensis]|uniref:uncharacterized protein LOC107640515 n=1 Tax=Arachis ipaensis TaxID=130454 RepID=UPI0007AFB70C|nr:uncharacterized protein LOC107640515 [Arachis ipaensis]